MQFNQATDYAFRVIMHLAELPEGELANSQTIAEEQNIPAELYVLARPAKLDCAYG